MLRKTLFLSLLLLASCRCEHPKGSYGTEGYGTDDSMSPQLSPQPKPMNFGVIFIGNFSSSKQEKVMDAIKKYCVTNICSIGLMLGNNINPFKDFESVLNGSPIKFFAAPGPKDEGSMRVAKTAHWEMPGRFYAMQGGKADFYALDTLGMPDGWLEGELKKGEPKWKVAFGFAGERLAKSLNPLFKENKVDFFLFGDKASKGVVEKDGTFSVGMDASGDIRFGHLLLTDESALIKGIGGNGKTLFEKEIKK